MKRYNFKSITRKNRNLIVLIYILLIVIIILNSANITFIATDYPSYIIHTKAFFYNPYTIKGLEQYAKYPCVYYYIMGFLGALRINTVWGIKLIWGIFDIGNFIILKRISSKHFNKKGISKYLVPVLYFTFPLHWYTLKTGENDLAAIFFLLLAFDRFLDKRYTLSAFLLTLGILFKVFPVFLLIPITVYFLLERIPLRKKFGLIIKYWGTVFIFFVLLSLPYIIIDAYAYFHGIFIHASRSSTGNSYAPLVPQLYETALTVFNISISKLFLIQISLFLTFFLLTYGYFYRRSIKTRDFKENTEEQDKNAPNNPISPAFFAFICIFSFLLPGYISFQDQQTVFTRFLPFLLLFITSNRPATRSHILRFAMIMLIYEIILFIGLLITQSIHPSNELEFNRNLYYGYYILYLILYHKYFEGKKVRFAETFGIFILFIIYELAQYMEYLFKFMDLPQVVIAFNLRMFLLYPIFFICILYVFKQKSKDFG